MSHYVAVQGRRLFCAGLVYLCWQLALLAGFEASASAHEVDHYSLPMDKTFVDLGPYWDQTLHSAVRDAVDTANSRIQFVKRYVYVPGVREALIAQYQSPEWLTVKVRTLLPSALMAVIQWDINTHWLTDLPNDGKTIAAHYSSLTNGSYSQMPILPDPRYLGRMSLMRSSLVKVHGTYMGTDKVAHFVSMGWYYYLHYRLARQTGSNQQTAQKFTVENFAMGPLSEGGLVGMIPTGVYSNADMAANYTGMKYYINVTEPVQIKGKRHPPMALRAGDGWRLQPHVRGDNQHFAAFVSDHYDEVFNPCEYEPLLRSQIRATVKERGDSVIRWYAQGDPRKQTRAFFDRKLEHCRSYFGEDYGHSRDLSRLVTIGNTCFADESNTQPMSELSTTSKQGRQLATNYPVVQAAAESVVTNHRGTIESTPQVIGPSVATVGETAKFTIVVPGNVGADEEQIDVIVRVPSNWQVKLVAPTASLNPKTRLLTWRIRRSNAEKLRRLYFVARAVAPGPSVHSVVLRASERPLAVAVHSSQVQTAPQTARFNPRLFASPDGGTRTR